MGFLALDLIPFVGILLEALAGEAYGPAVPAVQILLAPRVISAGFLGRDALAGLGTGERAAYYQGDRRYPHPYLFRSGSIYGGYLGVAWVSLVAQVIGIPLYLGWIRLRGAKIAFAELTKSKSLTAT